MRLRLGSYNVHGCLGRDRRRDPERIAAVIRSLEVDALGLQEVYTGGSDLGTPDQLEVLSRETGLEARFGAALDKDGLSFGNALLSSRPVVSVERHELPFGRREPRAVLEAALTLDDSGRKLSTFVTHLGLGALERRRQIDRFLELVDRKPRGAIALLGDFNEWNPFSRSLRRLGRRFGRQPAPATYPSGSPFFALDRIWVDPGEHLVSIRAVETPLARVASDHLPVVATVSFSEPSAAP